MRIIFAILLSTQAMAYVQPTPTPTELEKLRAQSALETKMMHDFICKQYPEKCATPTPSPAH